MLLKMAANATICSTFEVQYGKSMAGHVTHLATKLEDPTPIRSWFMSYNVSHWLALKMRTRPLRMCRNTWPVNRGQKQLHIWNPRPRFAYSLCNFYWATTTIKGRLLSSVAIITQLKQQIWKRRYYLSAHWLIGDVLLSKRLFHICYFSCVIQPQSSLQDVLKCQDFFYNNYIVCRRGAVVVGWSRST